MVLRIVPFSVLVGLMIVKYRPPSFGFSPLHVASFLLQLLLIVANLVLLARPLLTNSADTLWKQLKLAAFALFGLFAVIIEVSLAANAATPTLDLETQNR